MRDIDTARPAAGTKRRAVLTVDFEDYRWHKLRDYTGQPQPSHPAEVERQLDMLLELFALCDARATFFSVGRLAAELPSSAWQRITREHSVGCHSHEHESVRHQGPRKFRRDLGAAKSALEDVSGNSVVSYRAPYFSSDGCDPWFGESLAEAGFRVDSSVRIGSPPVGFRGTTLLAGGQGAVTEVPLASVGFGSKRLTVIGGTYFRLFPIALVQRLLSRSEAQGFIPVVYLHPYDVDPTAPPLDYSDGRSWTRSALDRLRDYGRESVADKLRALARTYDFQSIESVLTHRTEKAAD